MITVVANLKGGSGKSTIVFNLSVWLMHHGQDVICYDLDPQCTLLDVGRIRTEDQHQPELTVKTTHAIYAEDLLAHKEEVLIDVGAANMQAMQTAISVADRVLIPVPPSQPDVWATQRFLQQVKAVLSHPVESEVLAFINRADTHRSVRESDEAEEALEGLPQIKVIKQRICNRTMYRRTMSEGLAVFEMWPSCKAAREFDDLAFILYPHHATQSAQPERGVG